MARLLNRSLISSELTFVSSPRHMEGMFWKTKLLTSAILLVTALGLISCNSGELANRSGWVKNESGKPYAIVFVHGFLGSATETWTTTGEDHVYWPELIAKDPTIANANVYVLEYPTSLNASMNIAELAQNMRTRLKADGVLDHEHVFFVMHSMGGLVTRRFVLDNPDIETKIGWLFFFATPSQGSEMARLARAFSSNPQLRQLASATSDNLIGDLIRDWLRKGYQFPSRCAYEKRKTNGVMVVEFSSAAILCTRALEPIDTDHIDIVKPHDRNAIPYLAVKNAYDDYVQSQVGASTNASTKLSRELRLDYRSPARNRTELNKAIEIVRKEYGAALDTIQDFEFVDLANSDSKSDLVAVFRIAEPSTSLPTSYLSVFSGKNGQHENILTEKVWDFPHVFLVREDTNTYLVVASYGGSRGFMSATAYRRLGAGHFKLLNIAFDEHYNKKLRMLDDGLYLFANEERFRLVFKGDTVRFKKETVTASDLGSTTHDLRYLDNPPTFDGKPIDIEKPIVIGLADRIIVRHPDQERVLAGPHTVLEWVSGPVGTVLKPKTTGEGEINFPELNRTVKIQIR